MTTSLGTGRSRLLAATHHVLVLSFSKLSVNQNPSKRQNKQKAEHKRSCSAESEPSSGTQRLHQDRYRGKENHERQQIKEYLDAYDKGLIVGSQQQNQGIGEKDEMNRCVDKEWSRIDAAESSFVLRKVRIRCLTRQPEPRNAKWETEPGRICFGAGLMEKGNFHRISLGSCLLETKT